MMRLQVDEPVILTLPGVEAPIAFKGRVFAIYEGTYNGEAGVTPVRIPAGRAERNVSYNIDIILENQAVYKTCSKADVPKCWHWCWPEQATNVKVV